MPFWAGGLAGRGGAFEGRFLAPSGMESCEPSILLLEASIFLRISSSSRDGLSLDNAASQSSHKPAVRLSESSAADTAECFVALRLVSRRLISLCASLTARSLFSAAPNVVTFPATAGSEPE